MASWSEFLKPEVIARLAAVGLHSHTAVEGTVSGLHRSPLKGVSPEFDDYREYSFGDDLKNLDWRALRGRTGSTSSGTRRNRTSAPGSCSTPRPR